MLKSPNFEEFQSLVTFIHDELIDSQLQEVVTTEDGIALGFYRFTREPKFMWLVIDMDLQFPFVGLYADSPWSRLKKPKPVGLFISAHFKNARLNSISIVPNAGRVAIFNFNLPEASWELRIIPKQPNFVLQSQNKRMSWYKLKELAVLTSENPTTDTEVRSIPYMQEQWWDRSSKGKSKLNAQAKRQRFELIGFEAWVLDRKKSILKKQKALEQMTQKLHPEVQKQYQELGEHLKVSGLTGLKPEWHKLLQSDKKLSWNIENVFQKSKQIEAKKKGTLERIAIIEKEIKVLENQSEELYQTELKRKSELRSLKSQRKETTGEFRKLVLNVETDLNCLMGKNAHENLQLLRQAKAWDYWLHLKDYPSAYAIIIRHRDQKMSDESLQKAARWLAEQSLKKEELSHAGALKVVVVECRHVRPLKGDKIGRVTYHNARELLIRL